MTMRDCGAGIAALIAVLVAVPVIARVLMDVAVVVVVSVSVSVSVSARVGAAFRLEGGVFVRDDQVHAPEHLGQHVVGLDLQVVGPQLDLHVPVAQVVGRAHQVEGAAVLGAVPDHHHRLRRRLHAHQRAVLGHEHVAAAHHRAAGQEDTERAAGRIRRLEAAFLPHVPVQRHVGGALEQHRREAAAGREKLVGGEHGSGAGWCVEGWVVYYHRRYNAQPPQAAPPTAKECTMAALKLTQIGNSVGVVLPKEILARLKVVKGDTLFVTEAANGLMLTPYDPALDEQLALGREFMREYRDTFHQLAK